MNVIEKMNFLNIRKYLGLSNEVDDTEQIKAGLTNLQNNLTGGYKRNLEEVQQLFEQIDHLERGTFRK